MFRSAIAGLVQHYRSKSRGGSRSKSRLRTGSSIQSPPIPGPQESTKHFHLGAEIAGAALTGAAASKLWERHKEKKAREHDREVDDQYSRDRGYSHSRSRSRSYSRPRSRGLNPRDPADRELGLVEYGASPLPPGRGYDSAVDRHRGRDRSASVGSDKSVKNKRSRSRLRARDAWHRPRLLPLLPPRPPPLPRRSLPPSRRSKQCARPPASFAAAPRSHTLPSPSCLSPEFSNILIPITEHAHSRSTTSHRSELMQWSKTSTLGSR